MSNKSKWTAIGLALVVFVTAMLVLFSMKDEKPVEEEILIDVTEKEEPTNTVVEVEEETEDGPVSPTTGKVLTEENNAHTPFTVMIENSPAARPHSGLASADIVYEIEVEGSITRFLAVFNDEIPERVGPVRSSRHYYVPVAQSWDVPYFHFGGSPQAYALLKEMTLTHVDGIYESKHYTRDNSRKAPHNAYLVTSNLTKDISQIENGKFDFKKKVRLTEPESTTISIKYGHLTNVDYAYDAATNTYKRSLQGAAHLDRETNEQISPSNVVLLYADHEKIEGDTSGRIDVDLTSEGKARFFTGGVTFEGTWENENGQIRFRESHGYLVSLNPGKTFIQVVDTEKSGAVSFE